MFYSMYNEGSVMADLTICPNEWFHPSVVGHQPIELEKVAPFLMPLIFGQIKKNILLFKWIFYFRLIYSYGPYSPAPEKPEFLKIGQK